MKAGNVRRKLVAYPNLPYLSAQRNGAVGLAQFPMV